MKRNMHGVTHEVMKFFNKNFSDEQINILCKHLSVDSMRKNPSCNNDALVERAKSLNANGKSSGSFKFIRNGQVGAYKSEFVKEINDEFDAFMKKTSLFDDSFSYKIK